MPAAPPSRLTGRRFPIAALLLLALAVAHTLWATSLDGFTIDEPYHIAAGASYLRFHDFRINPEHPPLVKLAAGLAETRSVLHLPALIPLEEKMQERVYTQGAVFTSSDYHAVQRRSRAAMIVFHTLLLALLTIALRRVFSPQMALATLGLLALDPTVSAHMPVVMTDLATALLGTLTCALAVLALRCRRWLDWALLGLAAGALLATKHSAPVILLPVMACCSGVLLWRRLRLHEAGMTRQWLGLTIAAALSIGVLWSTYGFRYWESPDRDARGQHVDTFNRTLEAKIGDLHSPASKKLLTIAANDRLLPRAYLWGLADTLRAGVEGRSIPVRAFGRDFTDKAPWWVAFAFLAVKVPLPFLALGIAGLVLLAGGRLPPATARPLLLFAAVLVLFMAFIAKNGVFYAGIRHFLLVVPLLAIAAAACMLFLLDQRSPWLRALPPVAVLLIALPVLPQRRIWEYHNLLAGGSGNAWRYFDNESVDLGQRSEEIFAFCRAHVLPAKPLYGYMQMREQLEASGITPWRPTPEEVGDGHLTGFFLVRLSDLPGRNWRHVEALRDAQPVWRHGNAVVYHGTFYMPYVGGGILIGQAIREIMLKNGDKAKAERYLKRAVVMNPEATPAFIELGNFAIQRKEKEDALRLYRQAVLAEQDSEDIRQAVRAHIARVEAHPAGEVGPMRNPFME